MDQKPNYLSLILLDALDDENESDINFILERNKGNIDPSYVPQDRGIAPLHYVCGMGNDKLGIEVAKRFLEMGANPNCKTDDGMTPLHVAAIYGKVEIVRMLLKHGAELEVYDNDRKSPILYAFENCFFDVVQLLRDHIFLDKCEKKKQLNSIILSESKFQNSLQDKSFDKMSTPQRNKKKLAPPQQIDGNNMCINKNLLKVTNADQSLNHDGRGDLSQSGDNDKCTPNRINYNYDVTSPYYINITHRRHRPQPKFPEITMMAEMQAQQTDDQKKSNDECLDDVLSISMQRAKLSPSPDPEEYVESVNIFSLTQENLKELSQRTGYGERTRASLIEMWREKVKQSLPRPSNMKLHFDDINEMIDVFMENDHLNFTNTELIKKNTNEITEHTQIDSGAACGSTTSSVSDVTEYFKLPNETTTGQSSGQKPVNNSETIVAVPLNSEELLVLPKNYDEPKLPSNVTILDQDLQSSFETVPELIIESPTDNHNKEHNSSTNFIRSPKNNEYFLQMAEAYVHTDDENGLVFYETKLPSNVGNKVANQRNCPPTPLDPDSSSTSHCTNVTIPLDYETDTLRAELTIYGEPPGPITKTTKRLYVKRLMKYKRKTEIVKNVTSAPKETECKGGKNKNKCKSFQTKSHRRNGSKKSK